jgi:hypothetical protein
MFPTVPSAAPTALVGETLLPLMFCEPWWEEKEKEPACGPQETKNSSIIVELQCAGSRRR